MPFKYGRLPPRTDLRTLKLANYIDLEKLPPAPAECDWTEKVEQWPMFLNDQIGCCTCASAGHQIHGWTTGAKPVTDQDILDAYCTVSGYNPATGQNDNGAIMLDVQNYWRAHGIGWNKSAAFTKVDPDNFPLVKQAIYMLGGLNLGLNLPESAERQIAAGQPWTVVYSPWEFIAGGHAVSVLGYNPDWLRIITWGKTQLMDWAFLARYCQEAWAVIDREWLDAHRDMPGLKVAALEARLSSLSASPELSSAMA